MKVLQKLITTHLARIVLLLGLGVFQQAGAHGGVVADGDLCIIKINYLQAHFKIYQPLIDGHEQYCEDLPDAAESSSGRPSPVHTTESPASSQSRREADAPSFTWERGQ